ncbi:restriction endonuclease, partial [bacterium]|nr:restriction endonuclease [bacterium]
MTRPAAPTAKSALVPVIEDRLTPSPGHPVTRSQKEAQLLSLRVCDPACGSGHFLLAAARRIGYELAKVRSEADEPSPRQIREATREAITHCIYGVDKNPLAVDLCKVALWIEGYSRGKPLTFLDYRVRCGDSLVGVLDLDVLDEGIPDDAYQPVSGDDGQVARSLRDQNKEERGGQTSLFDQLSGAATAPDAAEWQKMETMAEETPAQVNAKRAAYQRLQQQGDRLRTAANLWTAAFFSPFTAENRATVPTSNTLRRWRQGQSVSQQVVGTANGLAEENRFFHWRLEFPQVFNGGGFDAIIGNPPWEMVQLDAREFFATRDPNISNAGTTALRNKAIKKLKENDPKLYAEYRLALHLNDSYKNFIHSSGRFPLTSFGRINLMAPFAEHGRALVHARGLSGLVLPTGIATNSFTQNFFADLVERKQLVQMIGFENEAFIFPVVHNAFKFCIFVISGDGLKIDETDFAFFCRYFKDVNNKSRHFKLSAEDFFLINPNTKTCPTFRTDTDAELTKKIYRRVPILLNENTKSDPWAFDSMLMFMMNTDSHLFDDQPSPGYLPLYEGKLIHQFDHRFATYEGATQAHLNSGRLPQSSDMLKQNPNWIPKPQYWVQEIHVTKKLKGRWERDWFIGFRDITSSVVERTSIFSLLPRSAVANNTPLLFLGKANTVLASCFLGNMNSISFDYITRQKISGSHLNFYLLKQLPVLEPVYYLASAHHFIVPRIAELVYTAWDIASFAADIWQEADEPL